jgi:hypothetical protein
MLRTTKEMLLRLTLVLVVNRQKENEWLSKKIIRLEENLLEQE